MELWIEFDKPWEHVEHTHWIIHNSLYNMHTAQHNSTCTQHSDSNDLTWLLTWYNTVEGKTNQRYTDQALQKKTILTAFLLFHKVDDPSLPDDYQLIKYKK